MHSPTLHPFSDLLPQLGDPLKIEQNSHCKILTSKYYLWREEDCEDELNQARSCSNRLNLLEEIGVPIGYLHQEQSSRFGFWRFLRRVGFAKECQFGPVYRRFEEMK